MLPSILILHASGANRDQEAARACELAGGAPKFYKGAAVTPVYEPQILQINKLRQKVDAGAKYIQTQGIFDLESLKRFMDAVDKANIKTHIMAGIIPLKAAGMAKYMNENVPGIAVPQDQIDRLAAAAAEALELADFPKLARESPGELSRLQARHEAQAEALRAREEGKQTLMEVKKAMGLTGVWNRISRAAEKAGIQRQYLHRLMKETGIVTENFRQKED